MSRELRRLGPEELRRLGPEELRSLRAHEDEVVIVDVRTRDARALHPYEIPGARWLPLADVVQAASTLPRQASIVTYCT